ncbi:excinuclease ABC subunit UvrB [Metamycoplasma phocicerebrale]|uniref:Excinuclease ABC subunit UvrB n=1 Tax=Metamycoplasma phocicerebrale TaxID=142649 RepID=A0A3T0TTP9_9BACT|nr:excinuclease ABC subunit UvrB [Metamycoplasma phocicerebrale]AZZ65346.1 excinuclease ABC subunit UvrB [Metamycoplasma phocicerebrale]
MNNFKLFSKFQPSGDQPQAIQKLVDGIKNNKKHQVLLGVTGSGKTFTLANVIAKTNRPALVISHNKTLASQLYTELKELFPENRVEYFISYFDYYRPEAYIVSSDQYVEKTSKNNKQIEAMRMSAVNALSTRRDTIVVASVASIYGEFNPQEYRKHFFPLSLHQKITRKEIMRNLVKLRYDNKRFSPNIEQGEFNSFGNIITLSPGYKFDYNIQIELYDDEIQSINFIDPITKDIVEKKEEITIFPSTTYLINMENMEQICKEIEQEMLDRVVFFKEKEKYIEAQRIEDRTRNDLDSIREFGYTNGMENYARYMDGRKQGQKPYTLFDYLHKDTIIYIDESHLMLPQLKGMYEGDRSRKETLVNYGFRLPSALDNRPLKYSEYQDIDLPRIYLSATPGDEEISNADGEVITQFIRPTGLLDPVIEIKPKANQINIIHDLLKNQISKNERTLILTHTKKSAEELAYYLKEKKFKSAYIHNEFKVFERNNILNGLRLGKYDVVIGINLLREGIDLPEVSLILVLDADVTGLSRDKRSLIQIVGRAARNDHGKVIFFADEMTQAMKDTIDDNLLKRSIQQKYNTEHNIVPQTIIKPIPKTIQDVAMNFKIQDVGKEPNAYNRKYIKQLIREMDEAAKARDFDKAIQIQTYLKENNIDID